MKKRDTGFTVIELLISFVILGILVAISVAVFSRLANSSSLERDAQSVLSMVEKARTMAINSVGGKEHGIKFSTNKVEIFSGTAYVASPSNVEATYNLPSKSTITSTILTGGVSSLYFEKLTGNASRSGSVTISPASGGAGKTIVIYGTGISEIQ